MEYKNYLPIRILHDFAERLERNELVYMLSGSLAMAHYSVYRFTADIDVIIEITSKILINYFKLSNRIIIFRINQPDAPL